MGLSEAQRAAGSASVACGLQCQHRGPAAGWGADRTAGLEWATWLWSEAAGAELTGFWLTQILMVDHEHRCKGTCFVMSSWYAQRAACGMQLRLTGLAVVGRSADGDWGARRRAITSGCCIRPGETVPADRAQASDALTKHHHARKLRLAMARIRAACQAGPGTDHGCTAGLQALQPAAEAARAASHTEPRHSQLQYSVSNSTARGSEPASQPSKPGGTAACRGAGRAGLPTCEQAQDHGDQVAQGALQGAEGQPSSRSIGLRVGQPQGQHIPHHGLLVLQLLHHLQRRLCGKRRGCWPGLHCTADGVLCLHTVRLVVLQHPHTSARQMKHAQLGQG